jgi:hypothetical protein
MSVLKLVLVFAFLGTPSPVEAKRVAPTSELEVDAGIKGKAAIVKYNESEALFNLQYARAAYCTPKLVSSWDCGEPCSKAPAADVRFFDDGRWQVQGYVAKLPAESHEESPTRCMVSFRGMIENWKNTVIALRLWMSAWPNWSGADASFCAGCRVYSGNAAVYYRLREKMWAEVHSLGCKTLLFSGHSMGGALVTMASLEARFLGYHVPSVYTFGKPKIGNAKFREAYSEAASSQGVAPPMWRLVHYYDNVPRMNMCLGDTPVQEPNEIYYTTRNSSSFKECTETQESDPTCSAGISDAEVKENGGVLDDHSEYIGTKVGTHAYIAECETREGLPAQKGAHA